VWFQQGYVSGHNFGGPRNTRLCGVTHPGTTVSVAAMAVRTTNWNLSLHVPACRPRHSNSFSNFVLKKCFMSQTRRYWNRKHSAFRERVLNAHTSTRALNTKDAVGQSVRCLATRGTIFMNRAGEVHLTTHSRLERGLPNAYS
jgi:hypothetical protein